MEVSLTIISQYQNQLVQLVDTRGTETDSILTEDGGKIGVARVSFDTSANNSTVTDFLSNSADNDSQFNLGLFDIKMFTKLILVEL